jgi:hypothetical protein
MLRIYSFQAAVRGLGPLAGRKALLRIDFLMIDEIEGELVIARKF